MSCWAIIPVKASGKGKSRLSAALDSDARLRLIAAMLEHVVDVVQTTSEVERICILGPSRHGLAPAVTLLCDPGGGLNAALRHAFDNLCQSGATRVLIISGDLPRLTTRDVELLARPAPGSIAVAPDQHGVGTNALSLPLPGAAAFVFEFGEDSFAKHLRSAERLGIEAETIRTAGLACDVDEPADLRDLACCD